MLVSNASVNSSCTQPPLPPPRATVGHLPTLSVAGVGHLQILCCLGPFPSFRHTRGFLSEYNYTEDWLICQGQQKIKKGCKGMFLVLCLHIFIAYQARITYSEIVSYQHESTFFGYWIKFLLILFEKHPFILMKLFITYNFTALYWF